MAGSAVQVLGKAFHEAITKTSELSTAAHGVPERTKRHLVLCYK